jgi:hypothetical protein
MINDGRQLSPPGDRHAISTLRPQVENEQQSNHVKKQYYGGLSSQIDLAKKEAARSTTARLLNIW